MQSKKSVDSLKFLLLLLAAAVVVFIFVFVYEDGNVSLKKSATSVSTDPQVQTLNNQSKSDDANSIQSDLDNTNLNNIDQGTTQINQNLTNLGN